MATNFSPCKGSYVLNQFPSNVMFGMNGFHVSASGAIQGHHGPLVFIGRVGICAAKGELAGYQHFLPFFPCSAFNSAFLLSCQPTVFWQGRKKYDTNVS